MRCRVGIVDVELHAKWQHRMREEQLVRSLALRTGAKNQVSYERCSEQRWNNTEIFRNSVAERCLYNWYKRQAR